MWVIGAFVVIVIAFVIYSHTWGQHPKNPSDPPPPHSTQPQKPRRRQKHPMTLTLVYLMYLHNAENGDKTYNISSDLTGNPDTKFTDTFNGKKICMYGKCPTE